MGGALGLLIARWCIKFILYISPDAIPRSREIGLDWRVLAFTIGVSFLTGILFGLVPALQAGVVDVHETLKETGRGTTRRHWLRSSLVVVEVASTLVLLIGAGLMIRSFYRLQNVNPGFSYARLASFTVSLPQKKYVTEDQTHRFFQTAAGKHSEACLAWKRRQPLPDCRWATTVGRRLSWWMANHSRLAVRRR